MSFGLGENVGRAFVKLYADGDDVPKDIKDALDDLDPIMKEAAERHADEYHEAYDKQFEKNSAENRDRLHEAIQTGVGRMDAIGQQMGTDLFDGLQLQLERELGQGDLADLIRAKLEDDFALNGSWDRLHERLTDLNREAVIGQMELDKLADEARKVAEQDLAGQHTLDMKSLEAEIRQTIKDTDDLADSTDRWGKLGRAAADDVKAHMRDLGAEIDTGTDHITDWVRQLHGAHTEEEKWSSGFRSRLHNLNVELDKSASLTGKIFGKGSRNDFFNLLGSAIEGVVRLTHAAPNILEKLLGGGEGGPGGFASVMKAAGSSVAGLAIAIGAVILALGPIAALVSGLSAAVVGLVASLGFAVAGIVAVAGVLLVPLAAAIGVVIAAMIGMDDQTRKTIFKSVDPLIDKLKDLGEVAGKTFGPKLAEAAGNLGPVLDGLKPIVRNIASSLGDVAISWSEMVSGPGFLAFRDAFGRFIPHALEQIGDIAGHTLGGIGGILRGAIPITREFLHWLDGITERFSDWANSKSGQQQLKHFFDEAADSVKAVWHFVAELSESIFELFDQGKGSGDTLFTELGDKIQTFVEWLKDPSNRDSIKDFFENGIDVAEEIGNLILDVVDFIDRLDNKQARDTLHDIFEVIGQILEAAGWLITEYDKLAHIFLTIDGYVVDFAKAVAWAAEETAKLGSQIIHGPEKAVNALFDALEKIKWGKLWDGAKAAFNAIIDGGQHAGEAVGRAIGKGVQASLDWFGRLWSGAKRQFGLTLDQAQAVGHGISSAVGSAVDKSIGFFQRLGTRTASIFKTAATDVKNGFDGILVSVSLIPGKIVGLFSGLAGKILGAIGDIDIGSLIHIPDPGGGVPYVPGLATGGTFGKVTSGPQLRWVGEDGPEAIVPLNRPLGQVDPSVRALSAIAQGMAGGGGSRVEAGAIVVHEAVDGRATAWSILNSVLPRI